MPDSRSAGSHENPIKTAFMLLAILVICIVALPFLIPSMIKGVLLRLRFRQAARHEGKFVLLVYSDSPKWKSYFEQTILPRVQDHAIILNLSEQTQWDNRSWAAQAFRHWGGTREFNPLAIVFCSLVRVHVFRFYRAFRAYRKGNPVPLEQVESRFLQAVMTAEQA